MRFFTLVFIVMWSAITAWCLLPQDKLPSISLPKGAQHNTFGELPIVEMADDGDFYEKDGDENKSSWNCQNSCESAVMEWCESKKFLICWGEIRKRTMKEKNICVKKAKLVCSTCPPSCDMLRSIGAGWTCNDSYGYGGIGWE